MKIVFHCVRLLLTITFVMMSSEAQASNYETNVKQAWVAKNGAQERLKGVDSPDGKLALFEFFVGDTTASVVVVASVADKAFWGILPVPTPNAIDDPSSKRSWGQVVKVLWSPDSKYLAVHESLSKHSELSLFAVGDGRLRNLPLKDLRAIALKSAGLEAAQIKSSGQPPEHWNSPTALQARVNFTKVTGKAETVRLLIDLGVGAPVIKLVK